MAHVTVGGPVNYVQQGIIGQKERVIAVAKPGVTTAVELGPAVTAIIAVCKCERLIPCLL